MTPTFARGSQVLLLASCVAVIALHRMPDLTLITSTGLRYPYDARLNFLSELARTQYGPVMTGVFVMLAVASGLTALGLDRVGRRREAGVVGAISATFVLLALLPTDLNDFPRIACDQPSRIEPCTWTGHAHDAIPNVLFVLVALVWWSLKRSGIRAWASAVRAGVIFGAIAVVLLIAAHAHLRATLPSAPLWVGLMQKSVIASALAWFAFVNETLVRVARMPVDPSRS